MPTVPVNADGSVMYYEDTGAPPNNKDYTTIALVHGLIFHSAIFHRLIPYATKHNLRLIFVNLRDYPGSSLYTKSELESFESDSQDVQDGAVRDLGRQMAALLTAIVRKEALPPATIKDGKSTGGISLLTWSMSNLVSLSLLANVGTFEKEIREGLETHLRTVILHDASIGTLGASPILSPALNDQPAQILYSPLRDTSLSFTERVKRFSTWVSAYYETVDDIGDLTPGQAVSRGLLNDPTKAPSVENFTQEELERMTDFGVLERSHDSIRRIKSDIYAQNLKLALGVGKPEEELVLKKVKVVMVWCSMTMVDSIWAAKVVHEMMKQGEADAKQTVTRQVELVKLDGANHFTHWDEPERFLNVLASHA